MVFGLGSDKVFAESPIDALRLELSLLGSQIEDLRGAMLSPEVRSLAPSDAGIALLRLDAIEAKVRAAVGRVEALEFHLQILSKDANNRIREFDLRLSELEIEGSRIEKTEEESNEELDEEFSNETSAFDKALLSFNASYYQPAIELFETFRKSYPTSINIPESYYWTGLSRFELGDYKAAASDFLESFSLDPSGQFAWRALLKLSAALRDLGQIDQACLTLGELKSRFPEEADKNLSDILSIEESLRCAL